MTKLLWLQIPDPRNVEFGHKHDDVSGLVGALVCCGHKKTNLQLFLPTYPSVCLAVLSAFLIMFVYIVKLYRIWYIYIYMIYIIFYCFPIVTIAISPIPGTSFLVFSSSGRGVLHQEAFWRARLGEIQGDCGTGCQMPCKNQVVRTARPPKYKIVYPLVN